KHSWKATERELAQLLGGERILVTGRVRGYAPDIDHPRFWSEVSEVKSRKNMPVLLRDGMDQAVKAVEWSVRKGHGDRLPMLIVHQDGQRLENAIVCVRLRDARQWWGIGDTPAASNKVAS
ncbi:MAG: hypothetical protein ACREQM_13660, partial [Candidatus Dormibacteraceae bacterium]